MNITTFLSRIFHCRIPRITTVLIIMLALSTPAFCGPIHDAAKEGDLAKVKALLENNRKMVSSKDNNGSTPLHLAAWNGHKDIVELLLANKADVNAKDTMGFTPLHRAAITGHKDVVELLLDKGANVNAKDNGGWTPLHRAAMNGHKDVVELLLANKADVSAKINEGMTPLDMAVSKDHNDIVALLRQHDGGIGTGGGSGQGSENGSITGPGHSSGYGGGRGTRMGEGKGRYMPPIAWAQPMPPYTEEARNARIDGTIILQAIIRKDGTVDSLKVLRGLGFGLDESAANTVANKWRFRPGTFKGTPVDATVNINVSFRIH
jgi:TonB family protein